MNEILETVIVIPLTSTVRKLPFYLPVLYNDHPGALACDQIKTIDKNRVGKLFGVLTKKDSIALSGILSAMFYAGV